MESGDSEQPGDDRPQGLLYKAHPRGTSPSPQTLDTFPRGQVAPYLAAYCGCVGLLRVKGSQSRVTRLARLADGR